MFIDSEERGLEWPRDPYGHVFLGRAVHQVGQSMFSDWTGREPWEAARDLPTYNQLRVWLSEARGAKPSDEDVAKELEHRKAIRDRAFAVQDRIASAAEAGRLSTAVACRDGGKLMPIAPHLWYSNKLHARFAHCMLSLQEPFLRPRLAIEGRPAFGYDRSFGWIFVDQAELRQHFLTESMSAEMQSVAVDDEESFNKIPENPLPQAKRERARLALRQRYKSGKVPKSRSTAQIVLDVQPVLRLSGNPEPVSADTIARVLGRKL